MHLSGTEPGSLQVQGGGVKEAPSDPSVAVIVEGKKEKETEMEGRKTRRVKVM